MQALHFSGVIMPIKEYGFKGGERSKAKLFQEAIKCKLKNWNDISHSAEFRISFFLCKKSSKKTKELVPGKVLISVFGILLPKLFWPMERKKYSSDQEKHLKFEAEGQELSKIYSNNARSEQFLVKMGLFEKHTWFEKF